MTVLQRRHFAALAGAALAAPAILTARAAEEVLFAGYGGQVEQYLRKAILPEFEKETGIKPVYVVGTALSLYARVAATRARPEIDIYWANDLTHAAGKQMGLYGMIDPKIVVNQDRLVPGARQADGVGVLSHISSTGIQFNAEKFRQAGWAPPTSWFDLWDPKYKGKLAIYSINVLYSQELLALMSRLMGGSESNIAPGLKKIRELKDMGQIAAIANTPAEMDNIMAQGQAWIACNGGIRCQLMKNAGAPMEFVNPKEGAIRYNLYLDPIKGAPHPQAAQKLIDFLLRADIQTRFVENIYYAPANRDVTVPPALLPISPQGDAMLNAMVQLDRGPMNRDLDNWIEQWNRVVEGK